MDITDAEFDDIIKSDKPVMVDFWAPWCGPCRAVSPILDQIAQEHSDKIDVVKLNIDENPRTPQRYTITGIPTMMVFQNGEVLKRITGAKPKPQLINELSDILYS